MSHTDILYKQLVTEIIESGDVHENRTGVNTRRLWGHMTKFDLANDGFPLLTQKKMAVKTAFVEMLGFCRGETDVDWYSKRGCHIWEADHARWHGKDLERDVARADVLDQQITTPGAPFSAALSNAFSKLCESINHRRSSPRSLGRIYGAQWRNFGCSESSSGMGALSVDGCDQLAEIINALKAGSNSRRLIMSAWAPHETHMMALPPCHIAYHFAKRGEFVDVAMWQRSQQSACAA